MQSSSSIPVTLSLRGRTALITGGSRGIGAAAVRLFSAAGAQVAFSYNAAFGAAQALAAEQNAPGTPQCYPLHQPLHSAADGRALVGAAIDVLERLDILIVNHGVWAAYDQPFSSMPQEQWSSTLGVNLDSVFGLVQAASEHMLGLEAAHPRHIVFVASTAAQRGEAFHADYAASKGALISLTKSLSSELAPHGILVNCVAPGWVATDMSAVALSDPVRHSRAISSIPLGRVGKPEEIAGPLLFLCTPLAGFISGEILNVNGGAVLVG